MKIVWKIIKGVLLAMVLAVCGLFIWRITLLTDKSTLKNIVPDDINRAAYEAANGSPACFTHEIRDQISKEGLFGAYGLVYIKDAHQVQFTVRYNDSIYKYTDYEKGTEFTYYLFNAKTGEYIAASNSETGRRFMYNYRRVIFDEVDFDDSADWVLYISADGSADGSFDTLPIHYAKLPIKSYKLTNADIKAFEK